jgi:hypothetical protein
MALMATSSKADKQRKEKGSVWSKLRQLDPATRRDAAKHWKAVPKSVQKMITGGKKKANKATDVKQELLGRYRSATSDIAASNREANKVRLNNLSLHKRYMKYYHYWRNYDLLTAILANTGLAIFFFYNESEMAKHVHSRDPVRWPNAMEDPANSGGSTNAVRMLGLTLSVGALYCLVQRHRYKNKWKHVYFTDDKETKLYYRYKEVTSARRDIYMPGHRSMCNEHFLLELLLLLATPIPYVDMYISHTAKAGVPVHYFLSEIMLSIMALRVFFIVRSYFNYSLYTDSYSKKLC